MLKDEDRIFKNLYNDLGWDIDSSLKRGDWSQTKDFILKTNCNCSYECALTYNILGNWRYQPSLISSILKF